MGMFSGPIIRARGRSAAIRLLLLIGLVAMVGWGFVWRFERHQERMFGQQDVQDTTGLLTASIRDQLYTVKRQLQTEFGLRAVLVFGAIRGTREPAPHTLYIAIAADGSSVEIGLPRLVTKALPDGGLELMRERLRTCVAQRPAGNCVLEVLHGLQAELRE